MLVPFVNGNTWRQALLSRTGYCITTRNVPYISSSWSDGVTRNIALNEAVRKFITQHFYVYGFRTVIL